MVHVSLLLTFSTNEENECCWLTSLVWKRFHDQILTKDVIFISEELTVIPDIPEEICLANC